MAAVLTPTTRRGLDLARAALEAATGRSPDPWPEITRRQAATAAMARATRRAAVQS